MDRKQIRWTWAAALGLLACGSSEMSGTGSGADGGQTNPDQGVIEDPMRACMQKLPRLTVVGNQLMVKCGSDTVPTRLKGINRSGLQHKNGLQMAGFGSDPTPELQKWRDAWKTVAVRIRVKDFFSTVGADLIQARGTRPSLGD